MGPKEGLIAVTRGGFRPATTVAEPEEGEDAAGAAVTLKVEDGLRLTGLGATVLAPDVICTLTAGTDPKAPTGSEAPTTHPNAVEL